jgi:glycosyltransferase involved in cell wall biosynthesis
VCVELSTRLARTHWRVRTTSSRTQRLARVADMLTTIVRDRGLYDIAQIDVYSGPAFAWAEATTFAVRQLGKPVVLTLHGGGLPAFARRWPGRVRRLLNSAAVVTVPSRFLLEEMHPYRSDLRLLPNPLDLQVFRGRTRSVAAPHMIWVRSFHDIYDPVTAIRVLAQVSAFDKRARLTMVGPDKGDGSQSAVIDEARRLGVMDRLHLTGRLERMSVAGCLDQHDIFLNTTRIDNTPLSVIEALACGLCVVSTDVGGLPYLLTAERTALLVGTGDSSGMAAAVRRLLIDPVLVSRLSTEGQRAAAAFDWTFVLPEWLQLLDGLAGGVLAA